MPFSVAISTKELERVAVSAYEGKTIYVMLCARTTEASASYTEETTVADWQTVQISGDGYSLFSATVGTGSYSVTNGRYEVPPVQAAFTSTGTITYDTAVVYFDGALYPHSVILEDPDVVLLEGQVYRYAINLNVNDLQ